jgi:hypothetical protein
MWGRMAAQGALSAYLAVPAATYCLALLFAP